MALCCGRKYSTFSSNFTTCTFSSRISRGSFIPAAGNVDGDEPCTIGSMHSPHGWQSNHRARKGSTSRMANLLSSTLTMIVSVTYYLELRNVISIQCTSRMLPRNLKFVVCTIRNIQQLYLAKDCMNCKRL